MPSVASLDTLHRAVAEFAVTDLDLVIEPPALSAARQSLDSSGLLLLGEVHGVRENPLLIRALMQAFGLTSLALEWPEDLTPMIRAFLAISPPSARTLVAAGNAHTPISPIELGVPMGALVAEQRPGTREVQISYGGGSFYNCKPCQFARRTDPQGTIRLHQHQDELVLDLPTATEAVVPQRSNP